ncbi:hypothetical protein FOMPIDRAFT_1052676 [Fomitopsis schrenkii]|uniref:Uncharacterized protein n=1 Tax=Fomitopsis schrenkii TaxID=2126942 RepID=S8DWZ2_FOMSC|nr:hypothetical protein FOMPIDRAFT_1052676 [Fomitopsis schrenkii]
MEDFVSYLHLLTGFFLLGAVISIGRDVAHALHATLVFSGFSFTTSDISGLVPFIVLQALVARTAAKLPTVDMVEDMPTVASYEGVPRRRGTLNSTTALVNYLAVMALMNTVVGVESVAQADLELALMPVAVMTVQCLDVVVGLASIESSLVPIYLYRASNVLPPLLWAPGFKITSNTLKTPSNKLKVASSLDTGAALSKVPVTQKPVARCGCLPFDVSALFRGQPLPAFSAEDLTSWDNTVTRHTNKAEPLVSGIQIDLEDLSAPGLYARDIPVSGLFPSASNAHVGFHTPCELPPLPRIADDVSVSEVVQVAEPPPETPAISAQFKWTAESGVPLMNALGITTAKVGEVNTAQEHSISGVDFRWNVTSGVPLMKALGFASTSLIEGGRYGGDFKWTAESGVPLMDALSISGVKLGVVHSI